MIRVAITGIAGRMGHSIVSLLADFPDLWLAGGTVRPGTSHGSPAMAGLTNERITERLEELLDESEVVMDFTRPDVTIQNARLCVAANRAFVTGTTGLDQDLLAELREIGTRIPVFYAPNMSLGIAAIHAALPVLMDILNGYDVEIVERHHNRKLDAPSGTALGLAESVASARDHSLDEMARFGRLGDMPRRQGEIGIHAVRAGGNAGEHELILAGTDEQVTISHRAFDRAAYARGALHAVTFLSAQPPGFYTIADLVAHSGANQGREPRA